MQLVLITRPSLTEVNAQFAAACARRGLDMVTLTPGSAAQARLSGSGARLVYRPATDRASWLLEKLVANARTVPLHDVHFACTHPGIHLRRSGLPMPRAVYDLADPPARDAQVQWLGGFPIVAKVPGFEGGAGVSRVFDHDQLQRVLADAAAPPTLEAFVAHARCWRLTVLGGEVIAARGHLRPASSAALHLVTTWFPTRRFHPAQRTLRLRRLERCGSSSAA